MPRRKQRVVASWLTAALRSRSTQRGSWLACRQVESCWRRERRAYGPTPKLRAFALQTDGAGAEPLSVWGSRGGGQCVESSFDTIPHDELMQCVARRVVDRQILKLIKRWLKVEVEERDAEGRRKMSGGKGSRHGTPQGGVISPLLANLYMHRFLKAWRDHGKAEQLRARLVHYADDLVILSRGHAQAALDWTRHIMSRIGLTITDALKAHVRFDERR